LTDEEMKILLKTKRIYLQILTFNEPLQPVRLLVENPLKVCEETSLDERPVPDSSLIS